MKHSPPYNGVTTLHGFTLVELLVVISITALLISILLPAIGKARDLAKQTVCAANLHQLSLVFGMYGADNKDWVPHTSHNQFGNPFPGEWFMFYHPYLLAEPMAPGPRSLNRLGRLMPVFDCPSTTGKEWWEGICFCGPDADPGGYQFEKPFDYMLGYAGNSAGLGLTGSRLAEMRTDTILLIDHEVIHSWVAQSSPVEGAVWNAYYPGTGTAPYLPGYHHSNGANILTIDMRVQWRTRTDYQPHWEFASFWMKEYLSQ